MRSACLLLLIFAGPSRGFAQDSANSGDVHVRLVLNADDSRTIYETNPAGHKSIATTTGPEGKMREKIRYDLDENGRFTRGEVLGPKEQFRFFALYKYDASGHLAEEIHLAKDQTVIGKIVFRYDAAGHQIGYSAFDGSGKPLGQTTAPAAWPPKRK